MSQSPENTTENNPFTKPGFIIAAALVVTLIAAGIVIFLLPKGDSSAQPGPGSPGSAPGATTKSVDSSEESACGLPSSSETALGAPPKSKWELVGKIAVPTDPKTFGPGLTDGDGFRSCFAHSPTGALYAAANVVALGSAKSQRLNAKLTDRLLIEGPGRDIAMKDSQTMAPPSGDDTTVQISGFLIKSYTPSEADVDLAFVTKTGVFAHTVLPLRWNDGDWKVKVGDNGQLINAVTQISDLSGFLAWSGV